MTKEKEHMYREFATIGLLKGIKVSKEEYDKYELNDEYIIMKDFDHSKGIRGERCFIKYYIKDFDKKTAELYLKVKDHKKIHNIERSIRTCSNYLGLIAFFLFIIIILIIIF